ncbi:hypothetical protein ASL83_003227 [Vibrio parahaemolyticus]|uniref:Uncharacterized protein n=1 Tax=Vibrio jasicida TaxID=766224 RepID=A0AAU9QXB9_9VIBR|nr:hypothetical protein [Vibrio parahaemolyticus]CAH1598412.1 hypothetical protein THF1C08_50106 [Vibrio jasicida]CAH1601827.1 hypothetical protein THF1A12_50241 [Vibrio jasicida]
MTIQTQAVIDLNEDELQRIIESLDMFFDFCLWEVRDIEPSDAILMALEFSAIQYGVVPKDIDVALEASQAVMEDFVARILEVSKGMSLKNWDKVLESMPYIRHELGD